MPPTGDYLSKFNSGLKHGDHTVDFAATGPKNYGCRTQDGKVGRNVREFTLNTRGQAQLKFDLLTEPTSSTKSSNLWKNHMSSPYTIHTWSNRTQAPKRSNKPSDKKSSSTNPSIPTPSNRTPTDTLEPNSMTHVWRTLTYFNGIVQ